MTDEKTDKYKNVALSGLPDEVLEKHGLKKDSSGKFIIQGSKKPVVVKRRI